jgi:hypothetical protein
MSKQERNSTAIEWGLIKEALCDITAEAEGKPVFVGEMQRDYPGDFKAVKDLLSSTDFLSEQGATFIAASASIKQAQHISRMIHSEDEGLTSIQEVLDMQPVNALTLVHLIRLEREHRAKAAANAKHNQAGGSREIMAKIRETWASGNFETKEKCASEECDHLGISYDTARKHLRNAPKRS